jgi:integrase
MLQFMTRQIPVSGGLSPVSCGTGFVARAILPLSRKHFKALITTCRVDKKLSTKTIQGIIATVRACLSEAVKEELITVNPAILKRNALRRPKDETKGKPMPFSTIESDQLIVTAREQFPEWPTLLMFALRTGVRPSELIELEWNDLDFATGTVTISRAFVKAKYLTVPKSGEPRTINLMRDLRDELQYWRGAQREKYFAAGKPMPGFVFPSERSTRLHQMRLNVMFHRIVKAAGLGPGHVVHDMRHTFASQLLMNGKPLTYVASQMGHSDISITARVYAHWIATEKQDGVDCLDSPTSRRIPRASETAGSEGFGPDSVEYNRREVI